MKIILIHGIGNNNPGWSDKLNIHKILEVSKNNLIEFNYEDLMENNWLNRILVGVARLAASYYATPAAGFAANYVQDYVDDILMYFVVPGIRKKILNRLLKVLEENPKAIVIGFSLGSIVAYETIKNFPDASNKPTLITLGSPLGSPPLKSLVKQFLKTPDKSRPDVKNWSNFYSRADVLSGKITGLGCKTKEQFKIKSLHNMTTYLNHVKSKLPQLF